MTEDNDMTACNSEDSHGYPRFIKTESSRLLINTIEEMLAELISRTDLTPSDDEFYRKFRHILDLYDRFQDEVVKASGISIVCSAGCSHCCCHWVEDVNSFEGAIIGRYLTEHHPDMVESVINSFRKDAEAFASLRALVDEKMSEYPSASEDIPDAYDLLLSCFYQLERPCALLDDNARCIVYPVRPLTCRDYLNLRDPGACLPDRINEETEATMVMYLSDTISERLEILHRRFDLGRDDMSLRSILLRCLESGTKK